MVEQYQITVKTRSSRQHSRGTFVSVSALLRCCMGMPRKRANSMNYSTAACDRTSISRWTHSGDSVTLALRYACCPFQGEMSGASSTSHNCASSRLLRMSGLFSIEPDAISTKANSSGHRSSVLASREEDPNWLETVCWKKFLVLVGEKRSIRTARMHGP